MAAVPQAKAAYKKKDGILTLAGDQRTVTWTPLPGNGPPVVSVAVANITSEQAVPGVTQAPLMLTLPVQIYSKPRIPTPRLC